MPRFNLDDYEPVEVRLAKYWADHPKGRVTTDLVHHGDGQFIVKAFLFREGEDLAFATGYAEETVGSSQVNRTSAAENCETSAIGRALANANYAAQGKRPSREEMGKVDRAEGGMPERHSRSVAGGATDETRLASEKQLGMLRGRLKAKGFTNQLPDGWVEAGLPDTLKDFPFSLVNEALEFIDSLEGS